MGLLDIIILIIAVAGLVLGYTKGFVRQISTICGLALGIIACHLWGDWATRVLVEIVPESASWPSPEYTTAIVSNIILFLFIFLGIKLAGSMFKSVLTKLHLGVIDSLAGSLLCVFKYLLVTSIILNIAYVIVPGNRLSTSASLPQRITMNIAPALLGVDTLPHMLNNLNSSLEENKNNNG